MKKRIRKAFRKLRSSGPAAFMRALLTPHHTETRIVEARARVAGFLRDHHGNRVAHGPFAGMILPDRAYWGASDISAKILGTYEAAVTDRLLQHADPAGTLVDIGSADGYFAVGALRAGLFEECLCFERSEKGRAQLRASAERNGVADRIRIHGEATEAELLVNLPPVRSGLVLCDIEGGEFDLLTDRLLSETGHLSWIIELHDILDADGARKRAALLDRAERVFDVSVIRGSWPDVSSFPELDHFDDDHRLLALSEGRDAAMDWLLLTPREHIGP